MIRAVILFFCNLLFLLAIYQLSTTELLIGFVIGWFGFGIGTSVVMHRYVSHKSFEFKNNFYKTISYVIAFMFNLGNPIYWALIHRCHHRFTDREGDIQSPLIIGKFHCFISKFDIPVDRYSKIHFKQLLKDKFNYFYAKYQLRLMLLYATVTYLIFGYNVFLMLIGVGVTVSSVMQGYINTFLHRQPFEDGTYSKNTKGSFFWFGENLHKSHHLNARRYSHSKFDISRYYIKIVGKNIKH